MFYAKTRKGEVMAEELIIGETTDPQCWAQVDRNGKLLYFHEGRARHLCAVGNPQAPAVYMAFIVLGVLDAERQRNSFDDCEFIELV